MKAFQLTLLLIYCTFAFSARSQQSVGLVLSGGGATGLCHIGVLKALEENGIPIDYITGTSAGALVGSMYAAGWSPEEIEAYVLDPEFQNMFNGSLRPDQHFLFREETTNAGMIGLAFDKDSAFTNVLPTNLTASSYIDFEMMKHLGRTGASCGKDFNNLFVPFRCVASDIARKESVVFRKGDLNAAVRASMTFPFYIKPIRINNVLFFDGGLYNNFPADVMYHDFNPDYIIGSNVSFNANAPKDDNLISQLTNMLVRHSSFELPCDEGFIIQPETSVTTFDFDLVKRAIEDGYQSALKYVDSIKPYIEHLVPKEEVEARRKAFRAKITPISVSSISTRTDNRELRFTRLSLLKAKKTEQIDIDEFEKRYFRLYSASQIDFIYPTLDLKSDSTYNVSLNVIKAKEFKVDVGGHISSRPVNTGYLGLTYQTIGKVITRSHLESYFGKFYGSAKADFTLEFPAIYPLSTNAYFTLNRWDYFRSFATFFEDVRPSFLVQNEMYGGVRVKFPFGNTVLGELDTRLFQLEDRYYQTDVFSNKDTADVTYFSGFTGVLSIQKNSLNRKQFATSGHRFFISGRYVIGQETSIPGTTSYQNYTVRRSHNWFNIVSEYQSFIVDKPGFHLGLHGRAAFSGQTFFANYTATLLSMNEFSLCSDALTFFLPEYRAPQFIGLGTNVVFTLRKKIDLRLDAYFYQPVLQVLVASDGSLVHSKFFPSETYMASASAIYHSFLGPIRATVNYFPKQETPFSIQASFGYVLFNERAIR